MSKKEFESLLAMVKSENLDDVALGMQLISSRRMSKYLFRYFWHHSNCNATDLYEWGLYDKMSKRIEAANIPLSKVYQINPYDYVK